MNGGHLVLAVTLMMVAVAISESTTRVVRAITQIDCQSR